MQNSILGLHLARPVGEHLNGKLFPCDAANDAFHHLINLILAQCYSLTGNLIWSCKQKSVLVPKRIFATISW